MDIERWRYSDRDQERDRQGDTKSQRHRWRDRQMNINRKTEIETYDEIKTDGKTHKKMERQKIQRGRQMEVEQREIHSCTGKTLESVALLDNSRRFVVNIPMKS